MATNNEAAASGPPTSDGVTDQWLESIGGKFDSEMHAYGFKMDSRNTLWLRSNGQWWMTLDSMYGGRVCPHSRKKTREEILRLMEALGIESKTYVPLVPTPPASSVRCLESVVRELVAANAVHKRKGTVLGKEEWDDVLRHLQEEVQEFAMALALHEGMESREELADILGIVVHAAVKLNIPMAELEQQEIKKLGERFEVPERFKPDPEMATASLEAHRRGDSLTTSEYVAELMDKRSAFLTGLSTQPVPPEVPPAEYTLEGIPAPPAEGAESLLPVVCPYCDWKASTPVSRIDAKVLAAKHARECERNPVSTELRSIKSALRSLGMPDDAEPVEWVKSLNPQTVACPDCNGSGKSGWQLVHAKRAGDVPPMTMVEAAALQGNLDKCRFCEGTGKVEAIQVAWKFIGDEWHAARKVLGVGMREWAERCGVLPSDYLAMEAGRKMPDPKCSPVKALLASWPEAQQALRRMVGEHFKPDPEMATASLEAHRRGDSLTTSEYVAELKEKLLASGEWPTHSRPSPASLHYHAFEQGMYAGYQGANHKTDSPYKTADYRMWWMHGCIVGDDRRELAMLRAMMGERSRVEQSLAPCELTHEEAARIDSVLASGGARPLMPGLEMPVYHPTPPAEGAESLKELTILRDYIGLAEGERAVAFERGRLIVDGPGGRRESRILLNSVDLTQLRTAGMPEDAEPGEWVKKLVNKINLQAAEIAGLKGTISGMQCGVEHLKRDLSKAEANQ